MVSKPLGSSTGLAWAKSQNKLVKFVVANFGMCKFGKKMDKIRVKFPKFMSKFKFKGVRWVYEKFNEVNLQVAEWNLTWKGKAKIRILMVACSTG